MRKVMYVIVPGLLALAAMMSAATAQEAVPSKAPVPGDTSQMAPKEAASTPATSATPQTQATAGGLMVDNIACGTSVEEKELMGAAVTFPSATEKIYCWSLITGGEEPTAVEHVWYHGGQEMARVRLDVNYPRVRTWSSKTMMPEWAGEWKVEAVDEAGKVLASTEFTLE